jgi:hypothetical protein
MGDVYDVTVFRASEDEHGADPVNIGGVSMVTMDEFGTLTVEAIGTLRSFKRGTWRGYSVMKVQPTSN